MLTDKSDESRRRTREVLSCSDILEACICGILEGAEPLGWLLLFVESASESSGGEVVAVGFGAGFCCGSSAVLLVSWAGGVYS